MKHSEICTLAKDISRTMGQAMIRYSNISNEDADVMPEHFLSALICDKMGDEYYIVMEVVSSKLKKWDTEASARLPELGTAITALERHPSIKPDLAFFRRDTGAFICLVEIKKDRSDWDRDVQKLKRFLPHVGTCPYGIVASYCAVQFKSSLQRYRTNAETLGHDFVEDDRGIMHGQRYIAFAEVIPSVSARANIGIG